MYCSFHTIVTITNTQLSGFCLFHQKRVVVSEEHKNVYHISPKNPLPLVLPKVLFIIFSLLFARTGARPITLILTKIASLDILRHFPYQHTVFYPLFYKQSFGIGSSDLWAVFFNTISRVIIIVETLMIILKHPCVLQKRFAYTSQAMS